MNDSVLIFNGDTEVKVCPLFENIRNSFTYEFWVKPEETHKIVSESTFGVSGISGQRYVVGPGHGETPTLAGVGVSVGTNGISVFEHTENHLPATLVYETPIHDWIHVAIVYTNGTSHLYINGEYKKKGLTTGKHVCASGTFGAMFSYGFFVGQLKDLRIWGYSRSESQIKSDMNKELSNNERGLVFILDSNKNSTKNDNLIHKEYSPKKFLEFPVSNDQPEVSIILSLLNHTDFNSYLHSLIENTKNVDYEIILDNHSMEEIESYLEKINIIRENSKEISDKKIESNLKNIKIIRKTVKETSEFKEAAKVAKGEFLLFLTSHVKVHPGWLQSLVKLIKKDRTIGIIGPKFVYPDGRLQQAGGIIWQDATFTNYGENDQPEKPEYNYVKEVDFINHGCFMIQSTLWTELGGYDSVFQNSKYNVIDLAFTIKERGFKVMYQPECVLTYLENDSVPLDITKQIEEQINTNQQPFMNKWKHVLQTNHFIRMHNMFLARERTKSKKVIVVIDRYVPHFNRDAGGRSTFHYIKLFVEMGFNVKFISDDFIKHEPYTSELQQLGVEVFFGSWYEHSMQQWIIDNSSFIHYFFINRPEISIKYIDILKNATKAKIIYYALDLLYLRLSREYELQNRPELLNLIYYTKDMEKMLLEKVHVAYYPSIEEIRILNQEFPHVVKRAIPLYTLDPPTNQRLDFSQKHHLIFVAGFDHAPNVDAVTWFTQEVFPLIRNQNPTIKLYLVGSNPSEQIMSLHSESIIVTGTVSDLELQQYYHNTRIAVVPLRYGAGVKGKVIEAMHHGIPVITTSIGAEGLFSDPDNPLIITNDPKEMAQKITALYNDLHALQDLSIRSIQYIQMHFSKERAKQIILQDFQP